MSWSLFFGLTPATLVDRLGLGPVPLRLIKLFKCLSTVIDDGQAGKIMEFECDSTGFQPAHRRPNCPLDSPSLLAAPFQKDEHYFSFIKEVDD